MKKHPLFPFLLILALSLLLLLRPAVPSQASDGAPMPATAPSSQQTTGVFRNPVVPGATISGYFDHSTADDVVVFYDGRRNNSPAYGFYFSCSNPSMYDFVGCMDNVSGEGACPNNRELWYDEHHGIDYEFSANWHTGAVCNPGKFGNLTLPIYAPARGLVQYVGYGHQFNGNHMFILHDENGNGNFYDDGLRAAYLHFYSLAVSQGQIVEEGTLLGIGGTSGYSSSPHLHFEVQRSSNNWATRRSVDPYGWTGSGADPWPGGNKELWKKAVVVKDKRVFIPGVMNEPMPACTDCPEWLQNNGFESGNTAWAFNGVDVIANTSHPNLRVPPYQGSWLGWLGGRHNADDQLWQDFTVPGGATSANLTYYVYMTTEETEALNYDFMSVRLRTGGESSQLISDLDYIGNTFTPRGQWVKREVSLGDLSAYQGQTLQIRFKATTDSNLRTSFYLDEVHLAP